MVILFASKMGNTLVVKLVVNDRKAGQGARRLSGTPDKSSDSRKGA